MNRRRSSLIICLSLFVHLASFSGENTWNCEVREVYKFDSSSAEIVVSDSPAQRMAVGSAFTVDRLTGELVGEYISSRFADKDMPVVLNRGRDDVRNRAEPFYDAGLDAVVGVNHWSAVWWTIGVAASVTNTLTIQENHGKDDAFAKPFIYRQGTYSYTGTCK